MNDERLFTDVVSVPLNSKPRTAGLTMVADWGLGPRAQADLLDTSAAYFDFAKVAVGIGRLLPASILKQKIAAYQQADLEPFPGGQFLEYAHVHGTQAHYFPAVIEAGYRWCEVSDNLADVSMQWKVDAIREAVERHGLKVLGEVGKKEGLTGGQAFVDDARACRDAGASIVLLEAAELIGDDADTARQVEQVVDAIGLESVMFELPGPWIRDVHHCDIHAMRTALIERYGPNVNLGNVHADDLLSLEAFRRGLGVNAGKM